MADPFLSVQPGLTSPAESWAAVVPSDAVDLPVRPRMLYVGTAGAVACVAVDGSSAVFNLVQGWHAMRPVRILATGTTAAGLIACW
ncbi:MAG: hypothetical protein RL654_108 [Pseudomonadota bacterium]|jgi:hypothetical protein